MTDHQLEPNTPASVSDFNGVFTSEYRHQLQDKRLSLGISYQQLGNFLQLSWSTLHKWENGHTHGCHTRHIRVIRCFLDGGYDQQIQKSLSNPRCPARLPVRGLPSRMTGLFNRLSTVVRLCGQHPQIGEALMRNINARLNQLMIELLNAGTP